MNRSQIAAFSARAVAVRAAALGTTITLDGEDITAVVSHATPDLNLEAGGLESPVDFVVRIAKPDLAEAPAIGAPVVIDGSTYRVTAIRKGVSPLAQDWILEVATR